jgi:transcriptional regulator with XRE-family HTH domain
MKFEHQRWFIGQNLLLALEAKGFTQNSFADMINENPEGLHISQSTISNIISNKQRAKGQYIRLFADVLEMQIEELIDNDPAAPVIEIGTQYGSAVGNHNTIHNHDTSKFNHLEARIQNLEQELQALRHQISHT